MRLTYGRGRAAAAHSHDLAAPQVRGGGVVIVPQRALQPIRIFSVEIELFVRNRSRAGDRPR